MKPTLNKIQASLLSLLLGLIAGTQKRPPSGPITLEGTPYAVADLLALFTSLVDALQAHAAALQVAADSATALAAVQAKVLPVMKAYVASLRTTYGQSSQALGDFGLLPFKPRVKISAEEQVAATAKMRATREARGTKGPKQRATIHGDVTGVSITPVVEPPVAEPQAQPAVRPAAPGAKPA